MTSDAGKCGLCWRRAPHKHLTQRLFRIIAPTIIACSAYDAGLGELGHVPNDLQTAFVQGETNWPDSCDIRRRSIADPSGHAVVQDFTHPGGLWPQCGCADPLPDMDTITSPFGPRVRGGANNYHRGIDIDFDGHPVHAIAGGLVGFSDDTDYGYEIRVKSEILDEAGQSVPVLVTYLHVSTPYKFEDDVVSPGEQIAFIDNSAGSHLHLGVQPIGMQSARLHPVRFLPRFEAGNAPKYQGDGVLGGDYYVTSLSPKCEEYDLVRIHVECYFRDTLYPELSGWKSGTVNFENNFQMSDALTFTFHSTSAYSFTVTLAPESLDRTADYHRIHVSVDPVFELPNESYVRVCLEDAAGLLGPRMIRAWDGSTSVSSGTCPSDDYQFGCAGNVYGDTPGDVALACFDGQLLNDGSVELCWVGSDDTGIAGVVISRRCDSGTEQPIHDGLLPFNADTVCFTDTSATSTHRVQL